MPVTTVFVGLLLDTDDLDLLAELQHALLDATGDDGATTGDREDVLDRHEERLVGVALGLGDVLVDTAFMSSMIPLGGLLVAVERLERATRGRQERRRRGTRTR